ARRTSMRTGRASGIIDAAAAEPTREAGGRMEHHPAVFFRPESLGCAGERGHFAACHTTAAGLLGDAPAVGENAAVEQILDERRFLADRIIAPDLPLHRFRRAAAVERNE